MIQIQGYLVEAAALLSQLPPGITVFGIVRTTSDINTSESERPIRAGWGALVSGIMQAVNLGGSGTSTS